MYNEKDIINGQYEVRRRLAGGMGYVYIAVDQVSERTLAIKTLKDEFIGIADATARFEREGKTWINLGVHENIVHAIAFQRGQNPLLLLEYVDGLSLYRLLRSEPGGLALDQAIRFAQQIANGLAHAHGCPMPGGKCGIIHRDLKPGNVMINRSCVAKLTDLGLALAQADARLTSSHAALGTLPYMPPEQWENAHTVTHRADIYALGTVLYEMLTGVRAFTGHSPAELMYQVHNSMPPPISDFRDDMLPGLAELVMQCLCKKPEDRPESAARVAEQLEAVAASISPTRPASAACPRCGYLPKKRHLCCPICDSPFGVAEQVPPRTGGNCACGAVVPQRYRFCIYCGRQRDDSRCAICGGGNLSKFRFCCHCGAPLNAGQR